MPQFLLRILLAFLYTSIRLCCADLALAATTPEQSTLQDPDLPQIGYLRSLGDKKHLDPHLLTNVLRSERSFGLFLSHPLEGRDLFLGITYTVLGLFLDPLRERFFLDLILCCDSNQKLFIVHPILIIYPRQHGTESFSMVRMLFRGSCVELMCAGTWTTGRPKVSTWQHRATCASVKFWGVAGLRSISPSCCLQKAGPPSTSSWGLSRSITRTAYATTSSTFASNRYDPFDRWFTTSGPHRVGCGRMAHKRRHAVPDHRDPDPVPFQSLKLRQQLFVSANLQSVR